MAWIFGITYFAWFFSEVYLSLSRRTKTSGDKDSDKGSLRLIWTIIIVSNFVAYYVAMWLHAPIAQDRNIRYAGLGLIILGAILRLTIVNSLGKYFTVNVTIVDDHKLKTNGFYKYLRHPSYSASMLSFVGYGISLNNWISTAIIFGAVFAAFSIRIRIEEKTLTEHFGAEYVEYMRKTKKLIPFIY